MDQNPPKYIMSTRHYLKKLIHDDDYEPHSWVVHFQEHAGVTYATGASYKRDIAAKRLTNYFLHGNEEQRKELLDENSDMYKYNEGVS